jgi:hypothetical protein
MDAADILVKGHGSIKGWCDPEMVRMPSETGSVPPLFQDVPSPAPVSVRVRISDLHAAPPPTLRGVNLPPGGVNLPPRGVNFVNLPAGGVNFPLGGECLPPGGENLSPRGVNLSPRGVNLPPRDKRSLLSPAPDTPPPMRAPSPSAGENNGGEQYTPGGGEGGEGSVGGGSHNWAVSEAFRHALALSRFVRQK